MTMRYRYGTGIGDHELEGTSEMVQRAVERADFATAYGSLERMAARIKALTNIVAILAEQAPTETQEAIGERFGFYWTKGSK